jgi:tetratricopeptide (TPR) repeat protein
VGKLESTSGYDRKRFMSEAERARGRKRIRKAIDWYRRVLAVEPHDPDLNQRIAPLLAEVGETFDAWHCFQRAAQAKMAAKQNELALQIYRDAARLIPTQFEAWMRVAKLERSLGRKDKARAALIEGAGGLRSRSHRAAGIALLRAARDMDPWEPVCLFELIRQLVRHRQTAEAQWLLEQLASQSSGDLLRRTRAVQWRIDPSLGNAWRWMRAARAARRDSVGAYAA